MKKFTESEINTSHYAESDELRNALYNYIEESLTPKIDGKECIKLTISGKEDLVEELIKIVENSSIDNAINVYKNLLKIKPIVEKVETDSLIDAFKQVNENYEFDRKDSEIYENARTEDERAMNHFNISEKDWEKMTDEEKKEKISKLPKRKGKNKDK